MGPGVRIDELDALVDSAMRVTLGIEISVRSPRIAMTVVPGLIQSRTMFISVSAVLSGTGTRNVLQDHRTPTDP